MVNQYDRPGADKQYLTFANNTYAAIAAEIGPALIAIANNLQALVFTDNNGVVCKTLQDASGNGSLPDGSVIVANSTGKATNIAGATATATRIRFPMPYNIEFGDQTTDGSVRMVVTAGKIVFQRLLSSSWIDMQEIS
jgi:hypothetical protein